MHGDVEQEGLYQNCNFHDPWGRGFDPRAGPNIEHFKLNLDNYQTNSFQFWHEASLGQCPHQL
jgi:hypothetical protein